MQLSRIIADVERGCFPTPDATVTVVPAPVPGRAAVLAFTAHSVVAADVEPEWVERLLPAGDLSAPLCPPFLGALSDRLGLLVNNIDLVCVAEPIDRGALDEAPELREVADSDHPRVLRSRRYRDDVAVWTTAGALVSVGRGLAGRHEVAPGNAASVRAFLAAGYRPVGAEAVLVPSGCST